MIAHAFCSRISAAEEGVFPGTGVRGEVYVFLPVPKRTWGRREFNAQWASPAELEAVRLGRRSGVTTRLYNPPSGALAPQILVYRSPAAGTRAVEAAAQLLEDFAVKGWAADLSGAPHLAICTQGTRDRCCAKWGFAVFRQALQLYREGRSPFQPLECSHLGGDRYAATGIFFPSGSMYGHLDRADLQAVAEADAAGEIAPGGYRGRVYDSELTQIVRAGLARDGHGVGATSPLQVLDPQSAPGDLRVATDRGLFQVSLSTVESDFFGSCTAVAQARSSHARRIVYAGALPITV